MNLERCAQMLRLCSAMLLVSNIAWWVSVVGASALIGAAVFSLVWARR